MPDDHDDPRQAARDAMESRDWTGGQVERDFPCCRSGEPGIHEPGCDKHPGFDLIPADHQLPRLYAQDGKGLDATVHVKLFLPGTAWTWYLTEYDPDDHRAFGYVVSGLDPAYSELGYVDVDELRELRVGPGFRVERDLHWEPVTIREAIR